MSIRYEFTYVVLQITALLVLVHSQLENEYCALCKTRNTHTMCLYPNQGPGPLCREYIQRNLTNDDKYRILDYHNKMRNEVALGFAIRNMDRHPPASMMMQLSWDEELQNIAQRWADQCVPFNSLQHDLCRNTKRFVVGQNIATYGHTDNYDMDFKMAMEDWFDEIEDYRPEWLSAYAGNPKPSKKIGHYTQFVWGSTQYIGCGSVIFRQEKDGKYWWIKRVVCNYAPSGNVISEAVYKVGMPCSKCPSGTSCNVGYGGLCTTLEQSAIPQKMVFHPLHSIPAAWVEEEYSPWKIQQNTTIQPSSTCVCDVAPPAKLRRPSSEAETIRRFHAVIVFIMLSIFGFS